MLEVRNATALTNCNFYLYTDTNSMWASSVNAAVSENGTYYLTGQTKSDLTDSAITYLRTFVGHNSSVVNADIRLSLYEGEYDGPFKPYSGTQLYASQAELKVQSDRIGMVVSNTNASSSLALTADAMEYIGDHVEIKGTDGTNTVISGGQIQTGSLSIGAFDSATQSATLNSNISVGGRNLFSDSKALSTAKWTFDHEATRGDNLATLAADTSSRIYQMPAKGYWSWKPNTEYVVSVEAKASASGGKMMFNMVGAGGSKKKVFDLTTSWARYSWAFTSDATVSTGSASIYNDTNTGTVQVRLPKLEEGNKATDWTAAPEDTDDAIVSVASDISESLENMDGTLNDFANTLEEQSTDIGESINEVQDQLNALREDFESEVNAREQ